MEQISNLNTLPENLPIPEDDGAAQHLEGMMFPEIHIESTDGVSVDTAQFKKGITVIYCYPMTGRPDEEVPQGWDEIPGARGCTPETLGYKDKCDAFTSRDVRLYGMSTQTTEYQKEMVDRLGVPFPILSDVNFELTNHLNLPTFEAEGKKLLKRLTMVVKDGIIIKVFYPVFPPDKNAEEVFNWIKDQLFKF